MSLPFPYPAYPHARFLDFSAGNNRGDILHLVSSLGLHFDQVVLLGYPPFLKEVVDAGRALESIDWFALNVKLVLAGEVVSEEWRDLMFQRCGMKCIYNDILSMFGTSDAGVIATETGISVALRRWLSQNPEIAKELFEKDRLPTLCQYDPYCRYLEICQGGSGRVYFICVIESALFFGFFQRIY